MESANADRTPADGEWRLDINRSVEVLRRAAYMAGMTKDTRFIDVADLLFEVRRTHPAIPDREWSRMLCYTPKDTTPAAWAAVRRFTIETAADMTPQTRAVTQRLMSMTARFHLWLWVTTGATLTVTRAYTQLNIDRYLATELKAHSPKHRWGVSRQLVKVGRELADADLIGLPEPGGRRRPPFTSKQIASMHSWANSLTTPLKRQNAWAILGLAGGAGLTSAEIIRVRVTDVTVEDTVVFVSVRGKQARRVPVRRAWANVLMRSIAGRETTDEYLFTGYRGGEYEGRSLQSFLTDHPAPTRPTPSLLRTGWILHHMSNNVPAPVIKELAGLRDFAALARYYEHAAPLDASAFTDLLVGSAPSR